MTSTTFFIIFIPILSLILLFVNLLLAPHNPYQEKDSVFECGFHSFLGQNRTQFSVSFFIFGLLFLLFDLEILLVYPYSVSGYNNDIYGLVIMMIFFVLLTLGFIFELGKNALTIDSRQTSSYSNGDTPKSHIFFKNSSMNFFFEPIISIIAFISFIISILLTTKIISNYYIPLSNLNINLDKLIKLLLNIVTMLLILLIILLPSSYFGTIDSLLDYYLHIQDSGDCLVHLSTSGTTGGNTSGTTGGSTSGTTSVPSPDCSNGVHGWLEDKSPIGNEPCCYDKSHPAFPTGNTVYYYCVDCGVYSCSTCH